MSEGTGARAPRWRPSTSAAKGGGLLLLIAIAIAFPQVFTNPAVTNYGVFALIYVTAATAWNIFSGNTGYISLGQAVFYGSGAYAMGIAARDWHIKGTTVFALLPLCDGGRGGHRGPVRPRSRSGSGGTRSS